MRRKKSSYTVSLSSDAGGAHPVEASRHPAAGALSVLGGQFAAFVDSLKSAFNVGAYLVASIREGFGERTQRTGGDIASEGSGEVFSRPNRASRDLGAAPQSASAQGTIPSSPAQKQAERANAQIIEINPLDRARKLHEIESKFAGQKSASPGATHESPRPPSPGNQPAPAQPRVTALANDGPDKLRETYHIPAASLAKMAFVFNGGAANDHAATTAVNTTKMVAQLGTLIGVAAGKKAAGDDAFANAHAQ